MGHDEDYADCRVSENTYGKCCFGEGNDKRSVDAGGYADFSREAGEIGRCTDDEGTGEGGEGTGEGCATKESCGNFGNDACNDTSCVSEAASPSSPGSLLGWADAPPKRTLARAIRVTARGLHRQGWLRRF